MAIDTEATPLETGRQPKLAQAARRQESRTGWFMAGPAVIMLVGFLVIPFFLAFYFSLTNQRLVSPNPTEWVGTDNFTKLLKVRWLTLDPVVDEATGEIVLDENGEFTYPAVREFTRGNPEYPQLDGLQQWTSWRWGNTRWVLLSGDAVFMRSLVNTFIFVAIVVPIQAGLALGLAVLINKRTAGVNVFRTIFFMPVVVSMVVVSILWSFILDGQNGLLNSMIEFFSFGAIDPIDWLGETRTALGSVIVFSIWQGVGFHMIIWLAGLQTIPGVLYEAAAIDGANNRDQFKHVTWPGLRNTAVFVLITISIQAFGLFHQIAVLTRGGPLDATQSIVWQAYLNGFEKQNIAYGSAISVVFFIIVLLVALIQRFLTRERAQ